MTTRTGRTVHGPAQGPMRQQLDELDALLQRILQVPVSASAEAEEPAAPPPAPMPPARKRPARVAEEAAPSVHGYPVSYMVDQTAPVVTEPPISQVPPPVYPGPASPAPLPEDVPGDPVQELARRRMSEEAGEWVPFQSSWQPSAQTWAPLAETWRQAQTAPEPAPAPMMPPPIVAPITEPSGPSVHTETVFVEEYPAVVPPPVPAQPAIPAAPAPAPVTESEAPAQGETVPVVLWPLIAFNLVFDVFLYPLGPLGSWLRRPSGRGWLATIGVLCLIAAGLLVAAEWTGWSW